MNIRSKEPKGIKEVSNIGRIALSRISPGGLRRTVFDRPEHLGKIEAESECALIILQDIAGTGKTTIARQWAARCIARGELVGWLSIDPDDNDLNTFLEHFAEALSFAGLPIERDTAVLLASSPMSPFKAVLANLLNTIARQKAKTRIVLDDLHTITNNEVKDAFAWMVDHLPQNLQLVLTTRETLPLKLSKLRSQGLVFEFPNSELRFSGDEVRLFFDSELGDKVVPAEQLEHILLATRGWPVALQFMALAAKQSSEKKITKLVDASRDGLFLFFKEEILGKLSAAHQQFLILCSILPTLRETDCNALLERSDSATVLEWLADQNFILGNPENGYRYCHPLFNEFLQAQLQLLKPKVLKNLHTRAFQQFQANGDFASAIEHAILAGQFDKAVTILESEGMVLIQASRIQELKAWLEIVPDNLLAQHPRLELFWIWILFHSPYPREAVSRMAKIMQQIKRNQLPSSKFGLSQRDLDVEVRVLAAGVLSSAGRSSRARQVALSSLNAMRDRSGFNKGTLCNILSYSEAVLGDVPAIRAASRLGYENHNRAKSIFGITYSELLTAFADYEAGDPFKAEHHLRQGRDFVQASLGKGSYAEALLSIVESQIKYDWNQLAMAKELLDASFPVVEQNGTVFFVLVGGILRAKLEAELGSSKLAIELLDSLSTAENKQYPMTMRHCILDEKVRILLKSDDLISAQVALRSAGIDPEELGHINREELSIGDIAGLMAVSRVYVAEARYPQAIGILKELEADALNRERTRSWIGISALMSIAYWKSGNKSESANVLLKALEKSASISSVRSFLDIGTDILQPLRQVRKMYGKISREPSVVSFCSTLIQIFENEAAEKVDGSAVTNDAGSLTSLSVEQSELLEPLTERENEIAMLLADGMTNSRISRSLDVSTETIKWHLKNIYQKLGVSNRTQAVIALTGQRSFLGTPDQK